MTAVRTPTARLDRRSVRAFARSSAALGRSTGRARPTTPLGAELRSSLLLLLGVLGPPLVLFLLATA